MAGGDHINRQSQRADFLQLSFKYPTEGSQNVGVIFHGFFKQIALIHQIVIQLVGCIMLTEGVIAEQYVVAGQVSRHAIGPMKHGHLHKDQLFAVAGIQLVSGFYYLEVPILMVHAFKGFYRIGGAIDGGIRDKLHQLRKSPAMIYLPVIGNYIIDFFQVDFLSQIINKLGGKGFPNGVHQNGLFFKDQIGIVGRSMVGG